jgi:ATP adenylyltransferase
VQRLDRGPLAGHRAAELHTRYLELLAMVGIEASEQPYNMLLTSRWMMVVPRAVEHYAGVSVNALGFAGSLLVPDRERLDDLRRVGPMAVLEAVAGT